VIVRFSLKICHNIIAKSFVSRTYIGLPEFIFTDPLAALCSSRRINVHLVAPVVRV